MMSRLATSTSKLGKRNAYVHECLSRILGNAITADVLDGISPQLAGRSITIYNLGDNIPFLFSMAEGANIKNTLLVNAARRFHQTSVDLVEKYKEKLTVKLNVGYVNSESNSVDLVSKYMRNSVKICNSRKYRNGPELSVLEMNQRTVLEYRTGQVPVFNAAKLMALANQMGNLKM